MLKRLLVTLLSVSVAACAAVAGQSPLIGEWKLDPSRTRTPDEMKVESKGGNTYVFDFGGGPETIVADGTDQKGLQGSLLSVEQEAADTWIVKRKMGGRLLLRATWKLSADGKTLTDYYRQFETDGSTVSLDYVYERAGGIGSGFAADWQSVKETNNATVLLQVKAFEGDGLSFISLSERRTRNVKFDEKDYPIEGANASGKGTASVRRVDDRHLVMTEKMDGKVFDTQEIVLSPDGKTLTMTIRFVGREKPNVAVFARQ
jgi:hypothetical protein